MKPKSSWTDIYQVVKAIPEGCVATYGQVAKLAGRPGHARQVGYALAAPSTEDLPWHRVINARGEISLPDLGGRKGLQRALLEDDGVEFDSRGRVDLKRFRWKPEEKDRVSWI